MYIYLLVDKQRGQSRNVTDNTNIIGRIFYMRKKINGYG